MHNCIYCQKPFSELRQLKNHQIQCNQRKPISMTRPSPEVSQPLAGPSNKSTVEDDVPNDQFFSEPTDVDMDVAPAPLPEKRPR
ncbi:hypothetical protein H0H93_002533 [Arthromyces matolae]|nr:hypothetical protein H0H93_002533 [Arthromyces matolae]